MEDFLDFKNCGKVMFADILTTGKENARKSSNLLHVVLFKYALRDLVGTDIGSGYVLTGLNSRL
jgi:hypothetical protein